MIKDKIFRFVAAAFVVCSGFLAGMFIGGAVYYEIAGCAKIKTVVVQEKHIIVLAGVIVPGTAFEILQQIDRVPAGEPITIYIDSPGGYVDESNAIIDRIKTDNHVETCKVRGEAASAAALITSACEKVEVSPTSYILFHLPFVPSPDGQKLRSPEMIAYYLKVQEETLHISKILGDKYYLYASGQDVELTPKEFLDGLNRR